MQINIKAIIQSILLLIFTVAATLGMVLIASYPTYQMAVPWQPEQKIQISTQLAVPLLAVALITAILYRKVSTERVGG